MKIGLNLLIYQKKFLVIGVNGEVGKSYNIMSYNIVFVFTKRLIIFTDDTL